MSGCILAAEVSDINGHLFKEDARVHFVKLMHCVQMHFCDVTVQVTYFKGAIVAAYTHIHTYFWHLAHNLDGFNLRSKKSGQIIIKEVETITYTIFHF